MNEMKRFQQVVKRYFSIISEHPQYESPMSVEEIQINYPDLADELLSDPIHRWRAETGIELIHKEPSLAELLRIWQNWQLMPAELQEASDLKSIELFGMTNAEHFEQLYNEMIGI